MERLARALLQADTSLPPPPPPSDYVGSDGGKAWATLAVLTLMLLVAVSVMIGHVMVQAHVYWMSEASAALLVGMVTGLVLSVASFAPQYEDLFNFNTEFFFIALLPPIMFDAGYNMNVQSFFKNIGGIMLLAFGGTIVSTVIIALTMYVVGQIGVSYAMNFHNCCLFGAIVSATDPVTVLAIFGRIDVNHDLNALVFGESVLNDAVAIVLYRVISNFGSSELTAAKFFMGVGNFVKIFVGSLAIGLAVGFAAALLFRSQFFRSEETPLEAALLLLLAFCSFYVADGLALSGIVSIMVCAMVMAKYVRPNLMPSSDAAVHAIFRMFAWLAETFIFVYIGVFLFFKPQPWGLGRFWAFIGWAFVALAVSRAFNVFPSMAAVNCSRPPEMKFPPSHQFMLWWSGLRGAMAFALAILGRQTMVNDGSDPTLDGKVVLTATFFLVLVTVLINGGATTTLLEHLDLRQSPKPMLPPPPPELDIELTAKPSRELGLPGDAPANDTKRNSLRDKMHSFHRTGGIQERFKAVDDRLTRILVNKPAASALGLPPRSAPGEIMMSATPAQSGHSAKPMRSSASGRLSSTNPFLESTRSDTPFTASMAQEVDMAPQ